jgi:hypothetical protein
MANDCRRCDGRAQISVSNLGRGPRNLVRDDVAAEDDDCRNPAASTIIQDEGRRGGILALAVWGRFFKYVGTRRRPRAVGSFNPAERQPVERPSIFVQSASPVSKKEDSADGLWTFGA